MSKETNPKEEVTVNDRRMFNPDGSLRQPLSEPPTPAPTESATTPVEPAAQPEPTAGEAKPERKRPTTDSPEFQNLIGMLTQNAAIHLGLDPQYGQGQVDIESARHFIDMIQVLKEKTEGNLSIEEERLLTDMISRLRMEYVSIVNQMTKSAKKKV